MCFSHLIYTVRPCLIHTYHAAPMPCSGHAVLLKATAQHGCRETAVLCCDLEKNGMASVNQTLPHCVNQMGKTHSKPLAARHGRGMLCVNRPLGCQGLTEICRNIINIVLLYFILHCILRWIYCNQSFRRYMVEMYCSVCLQYHTELIVNTMSGNGDFFGVQPGGAYRYHLAARA